MFSKLSANKKTPNVSHNACWDFYFRASVRKEFRISKIPLPVFFGSFCNTVRFTKNSVLFAGFMLSTQLQIETLNTVLRPPPEKFERKIKALSLADARPPVGPPQLEQNVSFLTTSACCDYDSILLMLMETTVIPDSWSCDRSDYCCLSDRIHYDCYEAL